jgi:hypothetical protein
MTTKTVLTKQMSPVMDLRLTFADPEMGFFEGTNEQDWWRVIEGGVLRLGFDGSDKMSIALPAVDSGKREALREALQSRNASFRGMEVLVRRLGIRHVEAPSLLKTVPPVPDRKWAVWSPAEREARRMEVASFFWEWLRLVLSAKRQLMSTAFPSVWVVRGALDSEGERLTLKLGILGTKAVMEVGVPVSWPDLFTDPRVEAGSPSLLRWDSVFLRGGAPQIPGVHAAAASMPLPKVLPPTNTSRSPAYANPSRTFFRLDGLTYDQESGQGWTLQEGEGA